LKQENNVALLTSTYLPVQGGIQYLLYWLLLEIDENYEEYKKRYKIDNLFLISPNYKDSEFISFRNIKVFEFEKLHSKKDIVKTVKSVKRIVNDNNIRLLHTHHALSDGIIGYFVTLFTKSEFILTSHGIDFAYDKRFNYGDRLSWIKNFILKMIVKRAQIITTVSSEMISYVNELVPKSKIRLIENCYSNIQINYDEVMIEKEVSFLREKFHINSNDIVYLTLSGARKIKGHYNMIVAFSKALNENKHLKLFIAAHGEETKELNELVRKLNVKNNIIFIDFITGIKKVAFFRLADVYVNTAFFEPFGLVYLESIQFDMAVLGSRKGGAVDIFEHKKSAYLIDPENIEEIIHGYIYLQNKKNQTLLKENSKKLLESYSPKKIVSKYLKLYGDLLNE